MRYKSSDMERQLTEVEGSSPSRIGKAIDPTAGDLLEVPEERPEGVPPHSYDEERLADLRYVLQPTRLRLLQQILATDWASLSPAELTFRNPDVSESTVRDHLREMTQRERPITAKLTVTDGNGRRDVPRTYYAVTEHGVDLLQSVDAYEGISLLYQLYESVERPDEIRKIEEFDHRPEPEWL